MPIYEIQHGNCLDILSAREKGGRLFDAVVTDPPYELNFMGKGWDNAGVSFRPDTWRLILSVMKPGAHLVAFGGSKTYHRIACAIEDAGFEIRDSLMWVYGQGFPKSHNVSKAIDRALGAEREITGNGRTGATWGAGAHEAFAGAFGYQTDFAHKDKPATKVAAQWQGWGTALKPAFEPIILARKPLEGTVAHNVLEYGCGGLNVDECRVPAAGRPHIITAAARDDVSYNPNALAGRVDGSLQSSKAVGTTNEGRWPANLLHDGSEEILGFFPDTASGKPGIIRKGVNAGACLGAESRLPGTPMSGFGDSGCAARFFPSAAYSDDERRLFYHSKATAKDRVGSRHPTVKPVALMRWLCRLVTPSGSLILDPFAGSGTTGQAALEEGFSVVLIEQDTTYVADIQHRLGAWGAAGKGA